MPGIMGSTVVNLGLNNSQFKRGLSESQSGLKSFSDAGTKSINPVSRAFAGLTAAAVGCSSAMAAASTSLADDFLIGTVAVGAAVYTLTGQIGKLAGVADRAAQTGLSGKFLQQLEFAADQSGVSAESLASGVKKLTVLIGKAAEGSKEAAASLSAFGLNADELKTLSPEAQFLRIAERIGQIPTAAGRASAAVRLFGKSGIEMTTLFAGGLNDIKKLMQDAADIGIGINDADLARVAAADDAIQKMKASFGAMLDQLAVGVAPAFEKFASYISGLNGPLTKVLENFNKIPDKITFLGQLVEATFDVATEGIRVKWDDMLLDLMAATKDFAKDAAWNLIDPFSGAAGAGAAGMQAGAAAGNSADLNAAMQRLDAILNQVRPDANAAGGGNGGAPGRGGFMNNPVQGPDGTKLRGLVDDIWSKVSPIADSAAFAAQGAIDRAKIRGGAFMGTLENVFGGTPAKKEPKIEPRLAGAMLAGSQEAYSTIVQAMIKNQDPNVKATKEQTRELKKALKETRPTRMAYVAAFEGVSTS